MSGFIVSPWASSAAQVARSERRTTVRATCSSALPGVPPGSTNERSGASASLYPQRRVLGVHDHRRAQVGTDVEELVLHAGQEGPHVVGEPPERQRDADRGVGLVGVGVGQQAQVVLAHPGQVAESRGAVVARARVDPSEVDHTGSLRRPRDLRRPRRSTATGGLTRVVVA